MGMFRAVGRRRSRPQYPCQISRVNGHHEKQGEQQDAKQA